MKEFDIKSLVFKHGGKIVLALILASLILNFGDFIDGIKEGWNAAGAEAQNK